MTSKAGKQAPYLAGIPVVASTTERDSLFPSPDTDQRVEIRATGDQYIYTGSAWVVSQRGARGGLSGVFDVISYGATGDGLTNDYTAIALAHTAAAAVGGTLYFPPGYTYVTNSVIDLAANVSLWLPAGATVKAGAAIAAVFRTPLSTVSTNRAMYGGGTVDCNFLANIGLHPRYFAHYAIEDLNVNNCLVTNIQAGESGMPSTSYELVMRNVKGNRTTGNLAPLGSRGLWLSNASDCKVSQTIMVGTETGFRVDTSNNDFSQVHAWSYTPSTGEMECCFDDNGFSNRWVEAYADTPAASASRITGGVTPYGFRFRQASGAVLVAPVCYNNNLNGLDNTSIAFRFDTTAPFATIIARQVKGADASHRWAKDIDINGSDDTNLNLTGLESSNIVTASSPDRVRQTLRAKGDFSTNRLQVGNGANVTKMDLLSAAITPSAVSANTSAEQTFTVSGAASGDRLIVTPPAAPTAGTIIGHARGTGANTVGIVFGNLTGGSLTPAAGTYLFTVLR